MEPEPELQTCFFNHQFSGAFCGQCKWNPEWNRVLEPAYWTGTRPNNYLVGTGAGWFKLSPVRKGKDSYGEYPILKCFEDRTEIIDGRSINFSEEIHQYFLNIIIQREVKSGVTTFKVTQRDDSRKRQREEEDVEPPKKKRKTVNHPKVVVQVEPLLESRINRIEEQLSEIKKLLEVKNKEEAPPEWSPPHVNVL